MKKVLEQGDYVAGLTEDQHRELVEIENDSISSPYSGRLTFNILEDGSFGLFAYSIGSTNLSFEEFKRRALNTFKP